MRTSILVYVYVYQSYCQVENANFLPSAARMNVNFVAVVGDGLLYPSTHRPSLGEFNGKSLARLTMDVTVAAPSAFGSYLVTVYGDQIGLNLVMHG